MTIPEKQRGRLDTYDASLKIAVAREYLTTDLGFTKLAKKYNLPGEATARHFLRWYRKKYPEGTIDEIIDKHIVVEPLIDSETANLKIMALQMLIEKASKELRIDLVKKFGTKQPKK